MNAIRLRIGIERPTLVFPSVFALALWVITLNALSAIAQQATPGDSGLISKSDAISGRVVNDNGQPIANATVLVRAFDSQGPGNVTTTDSEGIFRVSGLEARAYVVSAFVPLYVGAPRDTVSSQPQFYWVGDSVRIVLMKGAVVTGTVTTAEGDPVVAVPVHAYRIRERNDPPQRYGSQFRPWLTDDRGVYRIYGLPAGTYVVAAGGRISSSSNFSNAYETDTPTYAPSSRRNNAREIFLHAGEEVANVDIRYRGEPGFTISGSVSSPKASVEPFGVIVTLSSISNQVAPENLSSYQSSASQGFTIYGVADGDYLISAQSVPGGSDLRGEWAVSESQRIRVRGSDLTGIELVTRPLASIAGRVALEGSKGNDCKNKSQPMFSETVVSARHNNNQSNNQWPLLWAVAGSSMPEKDGSFTLRNLAPGQYGLDPQFFAKSWYLRSITLPAPKMPQGKVTPAVGLLDVAQDWITVKLGDRVSGLVITLAEGAASFHGQVIIPDGRKLPPRLSVFLVPAELESAKDVLRFFTAPATDGTFEINNVRPGRYWVIARPISESEPDLHSKLRFPDRGEARTKLRQQGETAKIEIDLKPCQNVINYSLPLAAP